MPVYINGVSWSKILEDLQKVSEENKSIKKAIDEILSKEKQNKQEDKKEFLTKEELEKFKEYLASKEGKIKAGKIPSEIEVSSLDKAGKGLNEYEKNLVRYIIKEKPFKGDKDNTEVVLFDHVDKKTNEVKKEVDNIKHKLGIMKIVKKDGTVEFTNFDYRDKDKVKSIEEVNIKNREQVSLIKNDIKDDVKNELNEHEINMFDRINRAIALKENATDLNQLKKYIDNDIKSDRIVPIDLNINTAKDNDMNKLKEDDENVILSDLQDYINKNLDNKTNKMNEDLSNTKSQIDDSFNNFKENLTKNVKDISNDSLTASEISASHTDSVVNNIDVHTGTGMSMLEGGNEGSIIADNLLPPDDFYDFL